jgi:hypothetical protein
MRFLGICTLIFFASIALKAQTMEALSLLRQDTTRNDSVKQETPASVPAGNDQLSGPRNYYNLLRNKAMTRKGLFTVHKVDDNYYFEIPDSILGRDLLVVSRIAQGAAGVRPGYTGYAGDQIGSRIIRFEKGPGHKLFLRRITYEEQAGDSSNAMYNAVVRSNLQPLVAAFGVGAYSPNGKGRVVEVTDYLNGDNDVLFFNSNSRNAMHVANLQRNMSYIKDVNAYPLNLELRTIKTYNSRTEGTMTLELNTSIVLLPKVPMKKRLADRRVGYFSERYTDYNANPQGVKEVTYIKRWKLEPKPEDVEKYKNGELVEPAKPIVYYIDPATPAKWIPYLKQGIEDWQVAFEKAGFKNAILAREAPSQGEMPNWSLEDSRHSAIVYKPSSHANAAGPVVTDPRSGEILESHINWYHNLMSILRDWYLIQCGPNDPRAQKLRFDDELMGQLIRSVASHEVGHTLGLTHNYGASSTVPVEKLRDRHWLEENGHTPSIMDYARFNYVAQPEDSVSERGLISRIGAYDIWAIEWGYRWYPDLRTSEDEIPVLNKWIAERMQDKALWFGSEFTSDDPRTQTEDLGDDAMLAGSYGIRNLQRVMGGLLKWTYEAHEGYGNLSQIYGGVTDQFEYYVGHVLNNIGGIYETPKTADQSGPVFQSVPVAKQKSAMDFIAKQVLTTPKWLLDTAVLSRIGESPTQTMSQIHGMVLNHFFNPATLSRLAVSEAVHGADSYQLVQYFIDIDNAMWTELKTGATVDIYRRNLQRAYVDKLIELSGKSGKDYRDVGPILKVKMGEINSLIGKSLSKVKDPMTTYHLKYIQSKLASALEKI